jgi:hypothetical protein
LQRSRAAGIKRDDDDVRWRKRLMTSAHPAARRIGSRTARAVTRAAAATATTINIEPHLNRQEFAVNITRRQDFGLLWSKKRQALGK